MVVTVIRCELFLYMAQSLKDKRAVIQSIVTRIRQRCNVSIAETNYQELWQRAELTLVAVGSSRKSVESELLRALGIMDQSEHAERTQTDWDWV